MQDNYENDSWEYIGTIGVDSGQMMLSDPCYVKDFAESDDVVEMMEAMKNGSDNSFSYSGACSQSNTPQQAGVLVNDIGAEMGVVCSSGFGDGQCLGNECDRLNNKRTGNSEWVLPKTALMR